VSFGYLKHHYRDIVQIVLLNTQHLENAFKWHFDNMKRRFIEFTLDTFLGVQKADYRVSGPFAYLKHHLSDSVQVAFFDAQDPENEFLCHFDPLKHRFIDFTQVVF
jgi:hypothetical protein